MPSPVAPSTFRGLIPVAGGSVCDKFQKAFVSFPTAFSNWFSYVYNDDGSFTTEFMRDICGIDCAALPPLTGGSGLLAAPTLTQVAPLSDSAITFSWSAIPGAAIYELARNTEPDLLSATFIGSTVNTTIADTTVSAGTWYYYWLQARGGSGLSDPISAFSPMLAAFASTASGLAIDATTPSATTTPGTASVTVTWTPVQGATHYDIYRNSANTNVAAVKIGSSTGLYFNDFNISPGVSAYYLVTAINYQQTTVTPNGSGALGSR